MLCVVDTHALVWFLQESPRLSVAAADAFSSSEEIIVPTMVLAEIKYLFVKKRIEIDFPSVISSLEKTRTCSIYPIDEAVVHRMPDGLEIHDALIVATALVYSDVLKKNTGVITKDRAITKSGFVTTIW